MIDQGRGEEAIETERMVREAGSQEDGTYGSVDLGQPKRHMDCVHRILGCAWVDYPNGDRSGEPKPSDFCGGLWNFFANLCCGRMCRCWFQFCGVCALAQEAREVERLIPAGRRRVDYVTFEPYLNYYNPIRILRAARNSNLLAHYATLSHLSSTLVWTLAITIMTMLVLSFIPQFGGFTKGDLCVVRRLLSGEIHMCCHFHSNSGHFSPHLLFCFFTPRHIWTNATINCTSSSLPLCARHFLFFGSFIGNSTVLTSAWMQSSNTLHADSFSSLGWLCASNYASNLSSTCFSSWLSPFRA